MPRKRQHTPLRVLLNNQLMGQLLKESSGAISFRYDESWLSNKTAIPVSLSRPLREDAFKGEPVLAVFENLLPDSEVLRKRVAEKVGANGTDAYSLLSLIGRDCVGALQFIAGDPEVISETHGVNGEIVSDGYFEKLLKNLARAPLGLDADQDFRISVAGPALVLHATATHDSELAKCSASDLNRSRT
jgi:serine/threonine-protein kinase HipA